MMPAKKNINEILRSNAKQAKILFDLCSTKDEGFYYKLHIIENQRFFEGKKEYRVYHSDGYCFDITKEKIELAQDECCVSCINGYEYYFNEGNYDGFKEISIEKAIQLLQSL